MHNITFAIIKPGAVARSRIGVIIHEAERVGLAPVRLMMTTFTEEMAEQFYAEHKGKPFFIELIKHTISGPCVFLILKAARGNAIADWRRVMGATDPLRAEPGTIRQMFGKIMPDNAVHGSDSEKAVWREILMMAPGWSEFLADLQSQD